MTGSVTALSGKALAIEFASFVGAELTHSRDFGRGDGEYVQSQIVALATQGAFTPSRPAPAAVVARGPSRFSGLDA